MFFQTTLLIEFVDVLSQIIAICIFTIFGLLFLLKSRDKPVNIRNYILGIVAFLLLYAISRVPDLLGAIPQASVIVESLGVTRWYIGAIASAIGLTILLFVLEKYILEKKTKYILTITQFGLFILGLLLGAGGTGVGVGKTLVYVSSFIALIIPIIYFQIGFKTTGETRKRSIGAGLGFFILYVGIVAKSQFVEDLFRGFWGDLGILLVYIFYCTFVLIGLVIYYISIKY